jgi:hypothetical protein
MFRGIAVEERCPLATYGAAEHLGVRIDRRGVGFLRL